MADRVLAIGLDAAERTLVERLMDEGKMPALQALRANGALRPLETDATIFAGGVWPTFYTGTRVPWHGIYHNKLWRREHMRCEIAHESWLPAVPFWERLDPAKRAIVVDVPMTLKRPRMTNGVHVAGWGTHDLVAKGTWPHDLGAQLTKEIGRPEMTAERFGPQTASTLLALRDEMLRTTEQMTRLATTLLERERWDLFLVVLGTLHRGGHYLWDLSQIDADRLDAPMRDRLEGALVELYRAADDFVGECVAKAPDAKVIVFAVHGMGPNAGWSDRCADLLAHVLGRGESKAPKSGLLYSVKKRLPWSLVREVTMRLPTSVTDRLVEMWSARMFDWSTTRCFPLPMDHAGYIRLNVAGREPKGIVQPGDEARRLLDHLEQAFLSFQDARTGLPIVREVHRATGLAPAGAPHRDGLPDLVIEWGGPRATECEVLRSDLFGDLRFESYRRLPSGRCGNHTANAWMLGMLPEHEQSLIRDATSLGSVLSRAMG